MVEPRRAKKTRARTPPFPEIGWAWFFDIDGTLVELASSPSSVVVHHELPDLMTQLHRLTGGAAVSLITGRAISDVDSFLPLPGFSLAGEHGHEFRSAEGVIMSQPFPEETLAAARQVIGDAIARHPGLLADFKNGSIALNYRAAPRLAAYAHRLMRSLLTSHPGAFTIQKGKRIVELIPAGVNKGVAIRTLMAAEPFRGRSPVFIGDDLSDEAGFKVVNEMSGHSVKVGPGRSIATWRLRDVTAVRDWLREGLRAVEGPREE